VRGGGRFRQGIDIGEWPRFSPGAVAGWGPRLTWGPARCPAHARLAWLSLSDRLQSAARGTVYVVGIFVVPAAALNTGNNFLFMVLACQLAAADFGFFLSRLVLDGVGGCDSSWARAHFSRSADSGPSPNFKQYEAYRSIFFSVSFVRWWAKTS